MKRINQYWRPRLKFFIWWTLFFGLVCLASGWGLRIAYEGHPDLLWFLPNLILVIMTLKRFFDSLFKERK